MQTFRDQWQVYSKLVDHDYLSHQAVQVILHRQLVKDFNRPFRFVDLACGDARLTVAALQGTPVIHYHGIDLSAPALAMARETVRILACPVELEQKDFVSAMRERPVPADVVWIGLALHHLQTTDKQVLMHEVRAAVGTGGRFLIYEPVRNETESRPEYLNRFEHTSRSAWPALTLEEWTVILTHVRAADFPEPPSVWAQLGREADSPTCVTFSPTRLAYTQSFASGCKLAIRRRESSTSLRSNKILLQRCAILQRGANGIGANCYTVKQSKLFEKPTGALRVVYLDGSKTWFGRFCRLSISYFAS